jgi:hypothetical protein
MVASAVIETTQVSGESAGRSHFARADARRTDRMSGLRCIGSPL